MLISGFEGVSSVLDLILCEKLNCRIKEYFLKEEFKIHFLAAVEK